MSLRLPNPKVLLLCAVVVLVGIAAIVQGRRGRSYETRCNSSGCVLVPISPFSSRQNWPAYKMAVAESKPRKATDIDASLTHYRTCDAPSARGLRTIVKKVSPKSGARADYYTHVCVGPDQIFVRIAPQVPAIVMTWDDAAEVNLKPNRLVFDEKMNAGHGIVRVAKAVLPTFRLGGIELTDVDVYVARDDEMTETVLGATFLKRLAVAQETDDNTFVLSSR